MLKPDAVHRGLVGEIIKRFEKKGFKLVAMKMMHVSLFKLSISIMCLITRGLHAINLFCFKGNFYNMQATAPTMG